jgi:hypothetical protein
VPQGESPNKIPVSAWEDAGGASTQAQLLLLLSRGVLENEYDDYEEDYEDADGERE